MRLWPRWRERRDAELQEEIQSHLELSIRDRIERGKTPAEAKAAARREFGNVDLVRAVTRDTWGWSWVDGWVQDVGHGMRSLHRYPGLTLAAVLTLGLGIGANTAVFSMMNALLLQPFPAVDPSSMVHVQAVSAEGRLQDFTSYANYQDLSEASVFSGLIASNVRPVRLRSDDGSEQRLAEIVSGNYFSVLGVPASSGRLLSVDDDHASAAPVVVVSESFWQLRFDEHPDILGKEVHLNGQPFSIVGVAPRGFTGTFAGAAIDFWVPLQKASNWIGEDLLTNRDAPGLRVTGRLEGGTDVARAQAAVTTIASRLAASYPDTNLGEGFRVSPARRLSGRFRAAAGGFLAIAMGFVALLLLAAGTNFVNLLLTRAVSRRRETSVRLALGASSLRLIRQHVAEGLVLSAMAGIAGLVLGGLATYLLGQFNPLPSAEIRFDFTPDARVLIFTIVISVITGLCLGLVPGLHATRRDVVSTLRDESAGAGQGRKGASLRSALVVAQVALSTVLLIGATLFLRSLESLQRVELGFSPLNAIAFDIDTTPAALTEQSAQEFYRVLVDRVETLPGVESATLVSNLPLSLRTLRAGVHIAGHEPAPGQSSLKVSFDRIGRNYFKTLRIPLTAGRDFTDRDDANHPGVAVINETMAERFWPGEDPIGKQIRLAAEAENRELAGRNMSADTLHVVGVARNVKYRSIGEAPEPHIYVPYLQRASGFPRTLVVRGSSLLAGSIQNQVGLSNRDVHAFFARTLEEHAALSIVPTRLAATLSAVFGTVAVLLATVGLYSVLSFWVARRSPEIGIQIALGAGGRDIWSLVFVRWFKLLCVGLGTGIVAALLLGRFLSSALYGVSPSDPAAIVAASTLLALVALVACVVPARRATRLDPVRILRTE